MRDIFIIAIVATSYLFNISFLMLSPLFFVFILNGIRLSLLIHNKIGNYGNT